MVSTIYVYGVLFLQASTQMDIRSLLSSMGLLARIVVGILFILSIYSFGVMIDRALMYSATRKQSRVFVNQLVAALREGKLDEAISIADRNKKSKIARAGARAWPEFKSACQQVSIA